jgi:hypothetical protein
MKTKCSASSKAKPSGAELLLLKVGGGVYTDFAMSCLIRAFAFVAPILMLAARPAGATLIITATNVSALPGGTAIVDFYLSPVPSITLPALSVAATRTTRRRAT